MLSALSNAKDYILCSKKRMRQKSRERKLSEITNYYGILILHFFRK